MPSPFPGMDPFIESQKWSDFHTRFITLLSERLMPTVRPKYVVDVEERVYVERGGTEPPSSYYPDVSIAKSKLQGKIGSSESSAVHEPVQCYIPIPSEVSEKFLTIRRKDGLQIVTVIEVLSPANKRSGADGYDQYLRKRGDILHSNVHFVEIDLLRGGIRMPLLGPVPDSDFIATVSRSLRRPCVDVYGWNLSEPLPVIPIPLADQDPDVMLDLQEAMSTVYDRAGYDYSIDYTQPVAPRLDEQRVQWIHERLKETNVSSSAGEN